ncbi:MAG: VRR-NUC domain-containing protein, partial [Sphingomonadaceae bacterium]|nr:VRR-NUC domain-containing protein [Sphingomonadaceae bacterium]
ARFIEFKAMKGRLSPEQVAMHAKLRAEGFEVWLVRSLAELQLQLETAGFRSRVRIAA